jgi:hypothetical protein
MVTQLHSTHVFELAKTIQCERIEEARVAHLVAQQRDKPGAERREARAWLARLSSLWVLPVRSRTQTLT